MKHIKEKGQTSFLNHGRGADRFDTELPVEIGCVHGLTRNISESGIYFETEMTPETGSRVNFTVEVNVRGQKLKLACEGQVVRIDQSSGVVGIAAKLLSSFFSDAAEVIDVDARSRNAIH